MRLTEVLKRKFSFLPPPPSTEWSQYVQRTKEGEIPDAPTCGLGSSAIVDYYGVNKATGIEKGRIRIPLGDIEHSYHISKTPDGSFLTISEGMFPKHD